MRSANPSMSPYLMPLMNAYHSSGVYERIGSVGVLAVADTDEVMD